MNELQYQLSNGSWVPAGDRTDEFLSLCERYNGPRRADVTLRPKLTLLPRHHAERDATRDEVIAALATGEELRNHNEDWYSVCRFKPVPVVRAKPDMVRCDCGHDVENILVMSASLGTACPDCYDRMSN